GGAARKLDNERCHDSHDGNGVSETVPHGEPPVEAWKIVNVRAVSRFAEMRVRTALPRQELQLGGDDSARWRAVRRTRGVRHRSGGGVGRSLLTRAPAAST